jgi:hypothetical protein
MHGAECRNRGRQNAECGEHGRDDAEMSAPEGTNAPRNIGDLINRGQRLLCLAIEGLPLDRGQQPTLLPSEQLKSKFSLEIANEPADGGLRHVQPLCRSSDRSHFEDGPKGL